jgi:hypothetical protein
VRGPDWPALLFFSDPLVECHFRQLGDRLVPARVLGLAIQEIEHFRTGGTRRFHPQTELLVSRASAL